MNDEDRRYLKNALRAAKGKIYAKVSPGLIRRLLQPPEFHLPPLSPEHVELWDAINQVVAVSGGSTACTTISRQKACARVGTALDAIIAMARRV